MSDFLKETVFFDAVPTLSQQDFGGSGELSSTNFGSAAESHDANDATKYVCSVSGDSDSLDGIADFYADAVVTECTAPTQIAFLRVRFRAKHTHGGAGGSVGGIQARINGSAFGTNHSLTGSLASYDSDFAVDPLDGQPWSAGKVNAYTFGFRVSGVTDDPSGTATMDVTEFQVQVWLTDVVATAAGASTVAVAVTPTADPGVPDGAAIAVQVATIDGGSVPAVIRSFKASLSDQDTSTKDTHTSGAGASGTQLQPLYGAGNQGVIGSAGGGNGINGSGLISGIKLFAIIRLSKQSGGTITNPRFGTAMGLKALTVPPTQRDYDQPLTEDMWETVQTALITEGAFAVPFEWGNGTNSVWANMFGWTFNYTYGGSGIKQLEVAEAWVEVHGPTGADEGSTIRLTLPINMPPKIMKIQSIR